MEALHSHCGIYQTTVLQTYALKMEAVCSSEMVVTNYQSTWCHNLENFVNKASFVFIDTDKPNHLYKGMYRNRMSTDSQCQNISGDWPPRPTHINVTSTQVSVGYVTQLPYHQHPTIPGCCQGCPHLRQVELCMQCLDMNSEKVPISIV